MLGEKTSSTPKTSPSSSPRPSNRPENRRESIVQTAKEQSGNFLQESTSSSLDGKISSGNNNSETEKQQLDFSRVEKSENNTNNTSKEKKNKKKSFWLNSFYPTYKSRSEDFKRIFKEVPDDERLIVDYSCAVQKEILVHGRLYVTQNFLCFYANIFGWETNIVSKWKEVAAITKEKTALVIPNAILILTRSEKFFFTSFVARDKVYLMLFRVWQNALMDKPMTSQEMWQWVHQSYGAELGLTSDDEDYIAPGSEDCKMLNKTPESIELEQTDESKSANDFVENSSSNLNLSSQVSSPSQLFEFVKKPTMDYTDSDFSDLDAHQNIQDVQCSIPHEGRQLVNEILPIHVDQLFTLLFTNSKFFVDFHAMRKNTNITQTPWNEGSSKDSAKSRNVNLTVSLQQTIGPKTAQVTETQLMHPCSRAGILYSITTESLNAGIPYADSFYVETHYCLRKVSERQSSLIVHTQVKFRKSVWGIVKSVIEKNCWSGLEDFFTSLSKSLQNECEEYVPDVKRKTKRRRKVNSLPRNENQTSKKTSITSKDSMLCSSAFTSEKITVFIFIVLLLMLFINAMLYHKLWKLEEEQPFNKVLKMQLLKNPPSTHEEWLTLIKKQDHLYGEEVKKWRESLELAINSLKQAEDVLQMLRKSIVEKEQEVEGKENVDQINEYIKLNSLEAENRVDLDQLPVHQQQIEL